MNNMGVLYSAKVQGKPDYCQVLDWFKKCAEGGNATGMWHLDQAYRTQHTAGVAVAAECRGY